MSKKTGAGLSVGVYVPMSTVVKAAKKTYKTAVKEYDKFEDKYGDKISNATENMKSAAKDALASSKQASKSFTNKVKSLFGGAKFQYKNKEYVVHTGARGGKYIVVKGKKVYI